MSTWDDPLVQQALAEADLSVTVRRWLDGDDVQCCECGEYRAPCPWDGPGSCDTAASFGILA